MFNDKNFIPTITIDGLQQGKEPRRVPSGEYDANILCADCDGRIIGGYEHYAQQASFGDVSQINPHAQNFINAHGDKAQLFSGIDYTNYKLFLLSILWRMSVSDREMFKEIQLAGDNEKLREMIYSGNPGEFFQYPIFSMHYFYDETMPKNLIISPVQTNDNGYPKVIMILPGYVHIFEVTVDPPFSHEALAEVVIKKDGTMIVPELATGALVKMIMNMRYI